MKITTPSGYEVAFKDEADLTYRDKRLVQRAFLSSTVVNQKSSTNVDMRASVIFEAQDELLKIILLSIKTKEGESITGDLFDYVGLKMPDKDAEAIYKVVTDTLTTSKIAKN